MKPSVTVGRQRRPYRQWQSGEERGEPAASVVVVHSRSIQPTETCKQANVVLHHIHTHTTPVFAPASPDRRQSCWLYVAIISGLGPHTIFPSSNAISRYYCAQLSRSRPQIFTCYALPPKCERYKAAIVRPSVRLSVCSIPMLTNGSFKTMVTTEH